MKKTARRLSAALLALILSVTLLTPALAAGEPIDTVSVVLAEELMPADGMTIPQGSYPNRTAGVELAADQEGYELQEAFWVSNGSSAGAEDKAIGSFREGNTYWLYVAVTAGSDASFADPVTAVLLNGEAVTGKISSGRTDRVSFFQPFTVGEPKSWTVTLNGNGRGTPNQDSVAVQGGYEFSEFSVSCAPDSENDVFIGWYTDPACTEKYVSQPIYRNLTLYAGWATKKDLSLLPSVTGIDLDDDLLTWDAVPGATGYLISFYDPKTAGESVGGRMVKENSADLYEVLAFLSAMAEMAGETVAYGSYAVTITAIDEAAYDPLMGTGVLSEETAAAEYLYRDPETILNPDPGGDPDPEPVNPFEDVEKDAYYHDAVLWAVDKGITKGTDETHFSPDAVCTRAQVVTFLWRAEGTPLPISTSHSFTDVDSGAYYYDAVLWAVEEGITNGTSETTFGPGESCTRAQIVTFLYRDMGT